MGYNLKTPPWDIPELKQDNIISFGPIVGFGRQKIDVDCSVDLKLGGLGDIRNSGVNALKDPRVSSMESSSSSGSSKRARALANASQAASCLVDGCDSDLSKCRDYHRRHKVCELHSKTPRVTIGGNEQRFCQQCSRFHSLVEFDEGKRSCRKRLDGHNRRRRKPQPESSSLNSTRFLSGHQGSKMLPFGSPQLYPSTSVASSAWNSTVKPQDNAVLYNSGFHGSVSHSYRGDKHFPFLQGTESALGCCQPLLSPNSIMGEGGGSSSQKLFSDGLDQVVDSNCARSLLSSSQAETREFGSRLAMQASSISPAQTMIPGMQYSGLGMEAEPLGSVFAADGSNNNRNTSIHSQEMFQIDYNNGGSSGNGSHSHQTISFSWE